MTVMAVLGKMFALVMVLLVPGGLVMMCAYFLARTLHHGWRAQGPTAWPVRLRRAASAVRWRDILAQARSAF